MATDIVRSPSPDVAADVEPAPASPSPSTNAEQLEQQILQASTAETCLLLAEQADVEGAVALAQAALNRAVALDRNCQPALLSLAAIHVEQGDGASTLAYLEEAARIAPLPEGVEALRADLFTQSASAGEGHLTDYLRMIGRIPTEPATRPLSIVLVTNLFPPQELGGYGRMMWEFAQGLIARAHTVRILTANIGELAKSPTPDEVEMERHVLRNLDLAGTWQGGRAIPIDDRTEILRRLRDNAARVRTAVAKVGADLVLAGNLDLLGESLLRSALDRDVPVLHALANAAPGYAPVEQPRAAHYWVAPCSEWNGAVFSQAGYAPQRVETLYPGARLDRFFRLVPPDLSRLRICYASLVMPYKGAHTLVGALAALHNAGIDFTAEIAGDTPSPQFLASLQETVRQNGMEHKVRFTGFLDRASLSALFARNNVLVFPSVFDEPFGISQVEALAAGLIVVSSGTGGAREIVRHNIDGLLFTVGDIGDLTAKLTALASDRALRERLQSASQPRATAFSVANAVQKIETLAAQMRAELELSQAPIADAAPA